MVKRKSGSKDLITFNLNKRLMKGTLLVVFQPGEEVGRGERLN